jgi:hypothetical protein
MLACVLRTVGAFPSDAILRSVWDRPDGLAVFPGALPAAAAELLKAEVDDLLAICTTNPEPDGAEAFAAPRAFRDDGIATISTDTARSVGLPGTAAAMEFLRDTVARAAAAAPAACGAPLVAAPFVQLAVFRVGARGYVPHRDLLRMSGGNSPYGLTAILYANEWWDLARDGGALRCYRPGLSSFDYGTDEESGGAYEDIAPELGTLALFLSPGVVHAVRPARRARVALTLWAAPGPWPPDHVPDFKSY